MVTELTAQDIGVNPQSIAGKTPLSPAGSGGLTTSSSADWLSTINQALGSVKDILATIKEMKSGSNPLDVQAGSSKPIDINANPMATPTPVNNPIPPQPPPQQPPQIMQQPQIKMSFFYDNIFNLIDDLIKTKSEKHKDKTIKEIIEAYNKNKGIAQIFIKKWLEENKTQIFQSEIIWDKNAGTK